ncbi:MAG: L-2-hydroxyglutarate oxidase [Calditrichia bacterium]
MAHKQFDLAIIGGGIVGTATAMAISNHTKASLVVLEAENKLAAHQTGNNSGVIHSGLYYKPGSLKARNCVSGREALYRFSKEHGIAHDQCGKLVVASDNSEVPNLEELKRRGKANGLEGIRRLSPEEMNEYEPHVAGVAALHVPQTGIIDYQQVTDTYAEMVQQGGGEIRLNSRVEKVVQKGSELVLETTSGEVHCTSLVNCAGLQSDRVAKMCGVEPGLKIVPFRGEYYEIIPERQYLVNNLIYPVPDPSFPFLGVHFTRMIHGGIEAGPNAVLAFKREGYTKSSISLKDSLDTLTYGGFWKLAGKFWKTGFGEMYRSFSKSAFVKALQKLMPELQESDVHPAGAGVRAQALEPGGALVDDFRIVEAPRMIHVLNAPSPAATASISIGETIAEMARKNFQLK